MLVLLTADQIMWRGGVPSSLFPLLPDTTFPGITPLFPSGVDDYRPVLLTHCLTCWWWRDSGDDYLTITSSDDISVKYYLVVVTNYDNYSSHYPPDQPIIDMYCYSPLMVFSGKWWLIILVFSDDGEPNWWYYYSNYSVHSLHCIDGVVLMMTIPDTWWWFWPEDILIHCYSDSYYSGIGDYYSNDAIPHPFIIMTILTWLTCLPGRKMIDLVIRWWWYSIWGSWWYYSVLFLSDILWPLFWWWHWKKYNYNGVILLFWWVRWWRKNTSQYFILTNVYY